MWSRCLSHEEVRRANPIRSTQSRASPPLVEEVRKQPLEHVRVLDRRHVTASLEYVQPDVGQTFEKGQGGGAQRGDAVCKDAKRQVGNGRNGRLGSHLPWADPRRGWDFVSTGHGDVPWEQSFRMLNAIGYDGPISVEWEDAGMDRLLGAPEALEFVRRLAFDAPQAAFDAAFSSNE